MAAYDYKKEFPDLYRPGTEPSLIAVPPMCFAAIEGAGDPNEPDGAYRRAVGVLYAVSYTLRMAKKAGHAIDGYFEYVVPPLEGLWWMGDGTPGIDYANKSGFRWISMIRLPEFAGADALEWAKREAARKKGLDTGNVQLLQYDEGLAVQCMHLGPYDTEPETVRRMHAWIRSQGCQTDIGAARRHHEIYLGDPRKCAPERLRTVLRHPVRRAEEADK
ncbi:MAG: GyrI-like domain-containing protein [Clostridia bacterium]|nr:GyrI-like domain-containing protein [Clostridia bacterium]